MSVLERVIAVTLIVFQLSTGTRENSSRTSIDTVTHGLHVTFSLMDSRFPTNALVRVAVKLTNVSAVDKYIGDSCPYGLVVVQVLDKGGHALYPPALDSESAHPVGCKRPTPILRLRPGGVLRRSMLVILRGRYVRVSFLLRNSGELTEQMSRSTKLSLFPSEVPRVIIGTSPTLHADLYLTHPVHGTVHWAGWAVCHEGTVDRVMPGGGYSWTNGGPQEIAPLFPCDVPDEWHAVAGWIGEPVVSIDYVK